MVCDILLLICGLWKSKKQKKRFSEWLPRVYGLQHSGKMVSSPSAWAAALREEGVFPECLGCGARGRGFLPRVLHSGKNFFFKKRRKRRRLVTNGVNSSPSVSTALGKAFPECKIFGSRRRRLSREEIPRTVFPECCTRGRLPRVHLALGEASASRSGYLLGE